MNVNSASFSISLLILDIYSFMDMFLTIVFHNYVLVFFKQVLENA
jgi:hypothetical protein